jgi:hypothetical protein
MMPTANDMPLSGTGEIARSLAAEAAALRPVRLNRGALVDFTAACFERPWHGCQFTLRRLAAFGYLGVEGQIQAAERWIDVLDATGDNLKEWPVTGAGFEYLRRVLRARRES